MRKHFFGNFISIAISAVCVCLCAVMLFQFKGVKDAYESMHSEWFANSEKQQKEIDDNYAAINAAGKQIYSQNKSVEQLKTQLESAKTELNGKTDYDDRKIVYLTFDDGPSVNTPKLLKILKKYNVKATFFVIGKNKTEYMKDIVKEGHTIALHSYTHDYEYIYKSDSNYYSDLEKLHELVKKETGVDTRIIRFPGGSSNTISISYCKGIMSRITKGVESKGYVYFDWNCDSSDADGNNIAADKLVSHTLSDAGRQKHLNILMHDTGSEKRTTVEALPRIIESFKAKGYSFEKLTVDTPAVHHGINN